MSDISLRLLEEKDIELVRKWRNSPEVSQYMHSVKLITEEQQKRWFEKMNQDDSSIYWIVEYENEDLGLAYITDIDKTLSKCSWGFYLGNVNVRGKGIGKKITIHVCRYVFEELELNKLIAEIFKFNERVIHLTEKFGFRREAYFREHSFKDGKYIDVVGIAMLRREYIHLKSLFEKI
ncbi:UDP-4-amino-4,6-dideoxy-N-acetyl-beta-L-altrosamine N-acetyltransferase [Gramella sp. Hel_I_59]|uniref:UDP-4-amino-4, 6-dideoxy-N-acetyl-beta-L-altrosamine N-acetyltransferase n=1 Tax=Gramella sp. Hel_I_59 TaxID=1249978 RepID=UPI00114F10D5|nr:UDP-4-amino-4,6-dideoxy-N-acetyl-beta-L-altrosamine N-acetyltransferase [Gramella sp. Hel_I_59]TQI70414.1 UDP-4-amino-4,6-dideoxy-N-acetyl-beta-L-altrosamine N-acetyltransferase [Gramella sp. Hel_I_59]